MFTVFVVTVTVAIMKLFACVTENIIASNFIVLNVMLFYKKTNRKYKLFLSVWSDFSFLFKMKHYVHDPFYMKLYK